jgi:uncharacterized protein
MRLTEITFDESRPIDGYGPGFFRIGGKVFDGPVAVMPTGVLPWGGTGDQATLLGLAGVVDVILIGTGSEISHIPGELRAALEGAGIGVETMASPAACRTYNILLSEGRRVGVALIPV